MERARHWQLARGHGGGFLDDPNPPYPEGVLPIFPALPPGDDGRVSGRLGQRVSGRGLSRLAITSHHDLPPLVALYPDPGHPYLPAPDSLAPSHVKRVIGLHQTPRIAQFETYTQSILRVDIQPPFHYSASMAMCVHFGYRLPPTFRDFYFLRRTATIASRIAPKCECAWLRTEPPIAATKKERYTRNPTTISLTLIAILLASCANFHTVDRATKIPPINRSAPETHEGVAIHLDAQQRVVLATALGYCAEPSPDALSAYAGSLGIGATISATEAISIAQALQSTSGSIGLRTQSITLMRDALYRMCEASNNGHLEKWEVATFLRRSQDLTAVILAVEQLTGAVTGNQVILTPDATNTVSARLLSNDQHLEQAEDRVARLQQREDEANKKLDELRTSADSDEEIPELDIHNAQTDYEHAKQRLRDAKEVRDLVKSSRDSLVTSVTQDAQGSAQFITTIDTPPLSLEATKEIVKAVVTMVTAVLGKQYTIETCFSYFTSFTSISAFTERVNSFTLLCLPLLNENEGDTADTSPARPDIPQDGRKPLTELPTTTSA